MFNEAILGHIMSKEVKIGKLRKDNRAKEILLPGDIGKEGH